MLISPTLLEKQEPKSPSKRNTGINAHKKGSVWNHRGEVYINFRYLGERAQENTNLPFNKKNEKAQRDRLDGIIVKIKEGTFVFGKEFPLSGKRDLFTKLERQILGRGEEPKDIIIKDYITEWESIKENNGSVSERTWRDYKSYINKYIVPFFGEMSFADLNANLEEFIIWCKAQKIKGQPVKFESIKKYFVVLKMIVAGATVKYGWSQNFDPFFGFKGFRGRKDALDTNASDDEEDTVNPFSLDEIQKIRGELTSHWLPYFDFAIASGVSPSEQGAIKPLNIDWDNGILKIRRAITLNKEGKPTEGRTKNDHRRRDIKLTKSMLAPLLAQKMIHAKLKSKYFFCSPKGCIVDRANFLYQAWYPALKRAEVELRAAHQTRHTFATLAISRGEDLNWIRKVMGHADTGMIIKHYSRFIANATGIINGSKLDSILVTDDPTANTEQVKN